MKDILTPIGSPFNVRLFGAKGDGTTDDTPAIQSAIDAALEANQSGNGSPVVLFPGGRYCIDSFHPGPEYIGSRLLLDSKHSGKIHLLGLGNATLCSTIALPTRSPDAMLAVWGVYTDILIENLMFQRKLITPVQDQCCAISIWGYAGQSLRPIVRDCVFTDFPQAVQLTQTVGAIVQSCRWSYQDGLACGRGNTDGVPNVGIRCDNCVATQIIDNYWVGTEKTTAQISPVNFWPMDGFLWGTSKGWTVRGNVVRRAFVEGIYCGSQAAVDPTNSTVIEGNTIDCDIPDVLDAATARNAVRQGIRADDSNILIAGNFIRKARSGIAIDNTGQPGRHGGVISNNVISFDTFDAATPGTSVLMGIMIQHRQDLVIQGNRISFPPNSLGAGPTLPTTGITLAACADVRIVGNTITGETNPTAAQAGLVGIYLSTPSTGTIISGNVMKNLGTAINQLSATPPGPAASVVGGNIYTNVPPPTLAGWQPASPT